MRRTIPAGVGEQAYSDLVAQGIESEGIPYLKRHLGYATGRLHDSLSVSEPAGGTEPWIRYAFYGHMGNNRPAFLYFRDTIMPQVREMAYHEALQQAEDIDADLINADGGGFNPISFSTGRRLGRGARRFPSRTAVRSVRLAALPRINYAGLLRLAIRIVFSI